MKIENNQQLNNMNQKQIKQLAKRLTHKFFRHSFYVLCEFLAKSENIKFKCFKANNWWNVFQLNHQFLEV